MEYTKAQKKQAWDEVWNMGQNLGEDFEYFLDLVYKVTEDVFGEEQHEPAGLTEIIDAMTDQEVSQ